LFFLVTVFSIVVPIICGFFLAQLFRLIPYRLDEYAYRLDGLLGFSPSFVVGAYVSRYEWTRIVISFSYNSILLAFLIIFSFYLWKRSEEETFFLLRVFVLNLIFAVPIYMLVPVSGPVYAFHSFPFVAPNIVPHLVRLSGPPNGVPSIHMSTALLTMWFAWRWKTGKVLGALYAILTVLATLGTGQHYLVDLIVSIPYAATIYRLGRSPWIKTRPLREEKFEEAMQSP